MFKLDTMSRLMRHLMPKKVNNKGFLRLFRDSGAEGAGGGGGGAAGTEQAAKMVIEGDASKGISNWNEIFSEEARKDPNISKYKTPDELYKGIKNHVEMIGKKGVILPTDKSTPEERETFLNAIGRPPKAEDYKFTLPDKLHPGIKVSPEALASFAKDAHKMGFTNQQANDLNNWYLGQVSQQMTNADQALQEAVQKADKALRADWGANYEAYRKGAAELVMKLGGQEAMDSMGGAEGIGNNPVILKLFGKLSTMMSEDVMKNLGGGTTGGGEMTKEQASKRLSEIQTGDKDSPYWNENHADHDKTVAEVTKLYKIVHSAEAVA